MWTPEAEQHFLAELEANPGSAEHALRFADWLESVGKPAHAELIRLHHSPESGGLPGGNWFDFRRDFGVRGLEKSLERPVVYPHVFNLAEYALHDPTSATRLRVLPVLFNRHQFLTLDPAFNPTGNWHTNQLIGTKLEYGLGELLPRSEYHSGSATGTIPEEPGAEPGYVPHPRFDWEYQGSPSAVKVARWHLFDQSPHGGYHRGVEFAGFIRPEAANALRDALQQESA